MLTRQQLASGLRRLELPAGAPVIAHASLSAFGQIEGGADALLDAVLEVAGGLMMPTFTYKTMLTPEVGPPHNGLQYGSGRSLNRMAEFFVPQMPADRLMGQVPETLRRRPAARRSFHPILSFAGIGVEQALASQTLAAPLAPVQTLAKQAGWALLLGVDQTSNTSIHYAELRAGRRQFVRWALTPNGVLECPGFPGCSQGFEAIAPHLHGCVRQAQVGQALVQAVALTDLVATVNAVVSSDPLALLCHLDFCSRCKALRSDQPVKT